MKIRMRVPLIDLREEGLGAEGVRDGGEQRLQSVVLDGDSASNVPKKSRCETKKEIKTKMRNTRREKKSRRS